MKKINSKDYHDYVFKDGKFIGAFEEMYQNVEDPWHHGDATRIYYDMILYLMDRHQICSVDGGKILDIGCGKGAFTARLKKYRPSAQILAVDIAPVAIKKAEQKYAHPDIDFRVMDIQKEYKSFTEDSFDFIVMSDIMWYILPNFEKIVSGLKKCLKDSGHLLINQSFYAPGKQKYGSEIVSSVEDMLQLIPLDAVVTIETGGRSRLKDHTVTVLFEKRYEA